MRACLTKTRLRIELRLVQISVLLSFICFSFCVQAARIAKYQVKFRNQLGTHLNKPFQETATNRFMVDGQQSFDWTSGYQVMLAGRVRSESAYSESPDIFTQEQAKKDSSDVELRDAYVQYKQGALMARLGNQQVVWGEAFGFFYADIVNPKDLRESTLTGLFELADLRDPIPLANLQWRGRDWTAQVLYGPTAPKNRMPRWGAPLSPISAAALGAPSSNSILIDSDSHLDDSKGDSGIRISKNFGNADISLFGFSYIDRMPYYKLKSLTLFPFKLTLQEQQSRIESYGSTLTYDWDGYLVRAEHVQTLDRTVNVVGGGTSLPSAEGDESVTVLGLDIPPIGQWTAGMQLSYSAISGLSAAPMTRARHQSLFGLRFSRDISNQQALEFMGHLAMDDGSGLVSGRWTLARSSSLEFLFGWEALFGGDNSAFGSMQNGSRVMMGIRGVFNGS